MKNKLLVILPAYNEEKALPYVIDKVRETIPFGDIVVVDDCSEDDTWKVAVSKNVEVLHLPVHLGVGGGLRTAFVYAVQNGYDYCVQVDSDGQHDPSYVKAMLEFAQKENIDILVGSRFAGVGDYKVRGPRWLAMKFLSKLMSSYIGETLTDTTSGYRLFSSKVIKYFEKTFPCEYLGDTIEALGMAHKNGMKIKQFPVKMNERLAGVPSTSPLKSAFFLFRALFAFAVIIISPRPKG